MPLPAFGTQHEPAAGGAAALGGQQEACACAGRWEEVPVQQATVARGASAAPLPLPPQQPWDVDMDAGTKFGSFGLRRKVGMKCESVKRGGEGGVACVCVCVSVGVWAVQQTRVMVVQRNKRKSGRRKKISLLLFASLLLSYGTELEEIQATVRRH